MALKATVLAALSTLNGYVGLSAITDKLSFEAVREGLQVRLIANKEKVTQLLNLSLTCTLHASCRSYTSLLSALSEWVGITSI